MAYYSLVASSSLFFAPTLYGLYRGHRLLPTLSLLSLAVSTAYWLDPTSREKRAIDMTDRCSLFFVRMEVYHLTFYANIRICEYNRDSNNISNSLYNVSCTHMGTFSHDIPFYIGCRTNICHSFMLIPNLLSEWKSYIYAVLLQKTPLLL